MSLRARFPIALALLLTACPSKSPSKTKVTTKPDAATTTDASAAAAADKPKERPSIPAPPDVAAPPADAEKTATGLASKVLTPGKGSEHPRAHDQVTVNYTGWTTDGKMFDTSLLERMPGMPPEPATFPLNGVIPGWTEGVQLMVQGEKRRFWIPEELAYKGQMGAPQGMLVFDVELLNIKKMPDPPAAPEDVAAPPKGAAKTAKGVSYKVLVKGDAKGRKPKPSDVVRVHYSGWTTDGKLFDSSVARDEPAVFQLDQVIPGWTDVVQQMLPGEIRRIWIPKELAYNDRPGRPQGMLVFDVELIEVVTPEPPKDLKAPPKDAEKTESGLMSKVLQKGTGTTHPSPINTVRIHHSAWTANDGKLLDSSLTRGQPDEFQLNTTIPGWIEGVQLMVEGEKRRFWIPEKLGFTGEGAPKGPLVFDIELVEIK